MTMMTRVFTTSTTSSSLAQPSSFSCPGSQSEFAANTSASTTGMSSFNLCFHFNFNFFGVFRPSKDGHYAEMAEDNMTSSSLESKSKQAGPSLEEEAPKAVENEYGTSLEQEAPKPTD